mgnify:CR=1 FL=1
MDCVTVFISVVLPTLLRQLFTGADCGWQPAPQQDERSVHGTESRNVGEANVVAELDGSRVAAVLAADTKLDVRAGGLTELASHLNELAYANLVELCERIVLVDLLIIVSAEELACVVTAEAEGHLSKVVVPKEKYSASFAISSAVRAALGISIMVPTL